MRRHGGCEGSSRGCPGVPGWQWGLTLLAMGLRQAAQMPAGAALMPSSCRSRVRLSSMLSSEDSVGTPAPFPAAASCQEGGW